MSEPASSAGAAPARPPLRDWLRDPRMRATLAGAFILLLALPFFIFWLVFRFTHSITNDAFVEAHLVNLAPQVPGQMVRILVDEHDSVQRGELLARIDPVPYERHVEVAQSKLAVSEAERSEAESVLRRLREELPRRVAIAQKEEGAARADSVRAEKQLELTQQEVEKSVEAAEAGVAAARAVLVQADEDFRRFTKLYEERSVPQRRLEEATKVHQTSRAELKVAEARQAQAEAARRKIEMASQSRLAADQLLGKSAEAVRLARLGQLQIEDAERQLAVKSRQVEEARRTLALAQTNLDYTRIVAPFAGIVVKRYRHLGDYVAVSAPILTLYNPELVYVTANLEEDRLEGVSPGNRARLTVDAFSKPFSGRVVWIGQATGANFALVPRDVTAGEFTRVIQRVPVRIAIDKDERWPSLRPGLSVTVAIEHGAGDPDWARQKADEMRALEADLVLPGEQP